MTEPTRDDRPATDAPPRLDYEAPSGGLPRGIQLTLGIVIALVVVMPLMIAGPIIMGTPGVLVGPAVGTAIVGLLALHLRQADRTRAMAAGIWTGVGIAWLVDGVCWMAIVGV